MATIISKPSHPTQFPNISSPAVDANGNLTLAWRQLLINLWNRTGQEQGGQVQITGQVIAYAADVLTDGPPVGWLVCDGSEVSRKTYAALFFTIGNQYGNGNGTTTFNVPDLAGGIVLGAVVPQHPLAQSQVAGIMGAGIKYLSLNYLIKT